MRYGFILHFLLKGAPKIKSKIVNKAFKEKQKWGKKKKKAKL